MSRRDVKVELNKIIQAGLGLKNTVAFTSGERVQFKEGQGTGGAIGVWWGKSSQGDNHEVSCPTTTLIPCMVDIYGHDEEEADEIFEALKALLAAIQPRFFSVIRLDADPLYGELHQTDGVRASILCRYVS